MWIPYKFWFFLQWQNHQPKTGRNLVVGCKRGEFSRGFFSGWGRVGMLRYVVKAKGSWIRNQFPKRRLGACRLLGRCQKGFGWKSQNRGVSPKMDGLEWKTLFFSMEDLGGKPTIFGNIHLVCISMDAPKIPSFASGWNENSCVVKRQ